MMRWITAVLAVGVGLMWISGGSAQAVGDADALQGVEKLASMNENTRGALDKAQRKLEHALTALQFLRDTDEKNAKNAYMKFKDEATEFRNQVLDVQDKLVRVEADTASFFASWAASEEKMSSERAKARSERRRTAAETSFRAHLNAFAEVRNSFDPAVTILMVQVDELADNYAARSEPTVAEAQATVQRIADDTYWQVDNALAKTELFD